MKPFSSIDLERQLVAESHITSLKSVLLALWYTATPTGKAAISKYANNPSNPMEATKYAKELLDRKVSMLAAASFSSDKTLRQERRKTMQRPISDEALIEFDNLTAKLIDK